MTVSSLPAGIHTIRVISSTGCEETVTVVISNNNMTGSVTGTGLSAACEGTGRYRIAVTGSISAIKVDGALIAGAGEYEASAGIHYIEYTDGNGCTGYDTFAILSVTPMNLSYASSSGDCQSDAFSLDVVISGGVPPYVINGNASATGIYTITNLQPGHIDIEAVDSQSCEATFEDIIIGEDCVLDCGLFTVSTLSSGSLCDSATGGIEVITDGVQVGSWLRYSLNGGAYQQDNIFTGLPAGIYNIKVLMILGVDTCVREITATINNKLPDGSNINITINNITGSSCIAGANSGSVIVNVSGIYTSIYLDGATPIMAGQISNLSSGDHVITVHFASAECSDGQLSRIFTVPSVSGIAVSITSQTSSSCGGSTGSVTLSVTPSGSYSLLSSSGIVNGMTVSSLPAGIHTIRVISSTGCEETVTVVISNNNMTGSVTGTGISAACEGTGRYRIAVTGSISAIKVDGILIAGAGEYEASAGIHYIEYTDGNGCTGYDTFAILSVTPMSLSYGSSSGDCQSSDLSLDLVISGGVPPYVINGDTSATGIYTLTDLQAGNVIIAVTDSNNCSYIFEFDLYVEHPTVMSDTGFVDTICSGEVFTYTPLSNVPGSTFTWTRLSTVGMDYATGTGSIDDTLHIILGVPVVVEYEYIVSGPGACYLSDTFIVKVLVYPSLNLELSHYPPDGSLVMIGTPITIISHTTPGVPINYRYSFINGAVQLIYDLNGGDNEYSVYNFNDGEPSSVEISATNEYGCEVIGTETFEAQYNLPNLITPKSPDGRNMKLLEGYDIQVFNRWGSELYRGTSGWDGRYKGTYVASGTYFYVLRYEQPNGKIITIKRNVFVRY
jgi:hypothetical protein